MKINDLYHPVTSRPYLSDRSYQEFRPCEALRSYVSCYWTMADGIGKAEGKVLVIPDTCMDIIVKVNDLDQTISGYLCGIQDRPFLAEEREHDKRISYFAIRFYFWAAHLFLNLNFSDTRNQSIELETLGGEWTQLFAPFFYIRSMSGRIAWVEEFLLKKSADLSWNPNLFNSIHQILAKSGREPVKEVCAYTCVSQRQMERMFQAEIGLPLKRIANLVRYQSVWNAMAFSGKFDIQDAVYRYGYTDQAHLLKEFRRFHGMTPGEAMEFAVKNR